MSIGRPSLAAGLFFVAGVFGFSLYVFFAGPLLPYLNQKLTDAVRGSVQRSLSSGNNMLYATAVSVDTQQGVLAISVSSRFSTSASPLSLSLRIPGDAYIVHQTLTRSGGVADGLSQEEAASLADIRPGDRVAVMALKDEQGRFFSPYVIFGDPL
jgi:hypothetical protein